LIGLGTYKLEGIQCTQIINSGLELGYRLMIQLNFIIIIQIYLKELNYQE